MSESIIHEPHDTDAWVCICGNTPSGDGFYPIDAGHREVEPTEKDWKTNQYFCNQCGRIVDQDSLEVVRRLDPRAIVRLN